MLVVNTIAPIALVVLLGAVLRRSGFASEGLFKGTNRLVFWVGLPCLLFHKTAQPITHGDAAMRIFLTLLLGTAVCVVAGYVVCLALRVPRRSAGAFVQGAYRGNLAYLGLPVVFYALAGVDGGAPAGMNGVAVLAIAPLIPIYNAVAVLVLLIGRDHGGAPMHRRVRAMLFSVATNPLLLACVAGILYSLGGWKLPVVVERTAEAVGQMALPLALLGIGAALSFRELRGRWLFASASTVIKVAVAPLAGYLIGTALGLSSTEILVAMLFLGCPTAVVSWVMAEQLDADHHLAAGVVVLATLLSMITLAVILAVA